MRSYTPFFFILGLSSLTSCNIPVDSEVMTMGDSVTWGYGDVPGGWVLKVQERTGVKMANLAIPGERSSTGASRMELALNLAPAAKTVIIMHGGNDWVSAFRNAPCDKKCKSQDVDDQYVAIGKNLQKMRDLAHKNDRRVVFSTYWPSSAEACASLYTQDEFDRYQEHMRRLNLEITKTAAIYGDTVVHLDEVTAIAEKASHYFDCLHPASDGYDLIADQWVKAYDDWKP
jgi:lysophospholipase L1-like esterase